MAFYVDPDEDLVSEDRKKLFGAAEGLDEAAAKLRAHAQEVREMLAAITKIMDNVSSWFSTAVDAFNRAVDDFKNAVKDIADGVADTLGFGAASRPSHRNRRGPAGHGGRATCRRRATSSGSRSASSCATKEWRRR